MRSSRTWAGVLVAGVAASSFAACGFIPEGPPSDASKADFCKAFVGSRGLFVRKAGAPIPKWETVRTNLLTIHDIGTPAGSDDAARNAVLRVSDIVKNSYDEAGARQQVDAYFDEHQDVQAKVTGFYEPFCK